MDSSTAQARQSSEYTRHICSYHPQIVLIYTSIRMKSAHSYKNRTPRGTQSYMSIPLRILKDRRSHMAQRELLKLPLPLGLRCPRFADENVASFMGTGWFGSPIGELTHDFLPISRRCRRCRLPLKEIQGEIFTLTYSRHGPAPGCSFAAIEWQGCHDQAT